MSTTTTTVRPYLLCEWKGTKVVVLPTEHHGVYNVRVSLPGYRTERLGVDATSAALEIACTLGGDPSDLLRMVQSWRRRYEVELADRRHRAALLAVSDYYGDGDDAEFLAEGE